MKLPNRTNRMYRMVTDGINRSGFDVVDNKSKKKKDTKSITINSWG